MSLFRDTIIGLVFARSPEIFHLAKQREPEDRKLAWYSGASMKSVVGVGA